MSLVVTRWKRSFRARLRRLKGGRSFRVKGKRKLGNKVTSTASGDPRDDKSFRVAQQQKTKAIPGGKKERGSAEQTRNLMWGKPQGLLARTRSWVDQRITE